MVDRVISVGVVTPHAAIGPAEEFEVMPPGRLTTRVVQVPVRASDASTLGAAPSSTAALRELTSSRFLDEAADTLAEESLDVVGYASTSSAYAIGFDAEAALLSRLAARLRVPAVGTCASAVLAFQTLGVERIDELDAADDVIVEWLFLKKSRRSSSRLVDVTSCDPPGRGAHLFLGVGRTPCRWELSRLLNSIRGRQAAKAKREFAGTEVLLVVRGAGLKGSLRESMCQAAIRILRATAASAALV
jgi:hypothetical protein